MDAARVYFVSRHPGALRWWRRQGLKATHLQHLDPAILREGDVVVGTLSVHTAAEVCARGARYLHLVIHMEPGLRGTSLSRVQMEELGAHLREYSVTEVPGGAARLKR